MEIGMMMETGIMGPIMEDEKVDDVIFSTNTGMQRKRRKAISVPLPMEHKKTRQRQYSMVPLSNSNKRDIEKNRKKKGKKSTLNQASLKSKISDENMVYDKLGF